MNRLILCLLALGAGAGLLIATAVATPPVGQGTGSNPNMVGPYTKPDAQNSVNATYANNADTSNYANAANTANSATSCTGTSSQCGGGVIIGGITYQIDPPTKAQIGLASITVCHNNPAPAHNVTTTATGYYTKWAEYLNGVKVGDMPMSSTAQSNEGPYQNPQALGQLGNPVSTYTDNLSATFQLYRTQTIQNLCQLCQCP